MAWQCPECQRFVSDEKTECICEKKHDKPNNRASDQKVVKTNKNNINLKKLNTLVPIAVFVIIVIVGAFTAKDEKRHDSLELNNTYVTRENYAFSVSKEYLDDAVKYVSQGDKVAFYSMVSQGKIFLTRKGAVVYLDEIDVFSGYIKIRPAGKTVSFWTVRKAIEERE